MDIVPLFRNLEQIAWKANSSMDTDAILQEIVRSVVQHSPWSICWAGLLDETRTRVVLHYDSGLWHDIRDPQHWTLEDSPSLIALDRGEPVCISDVRLEDAYPSVQSDARARGFSGVLIIPLRTEAAPGTLWLCSAEPRVHTEAEIAFGKVVGALTAIALNNAQYFRRERLLRETQEEQYATLHRLHGVAEHQNEMLSRLSSVHDRLLRIVLGQGGFPALAQAIGDLLERPTAILDQFADVLATDSVEDGAAEELSQALRQQAPSSLRAMEALRPGALSLAESEVIVAPVVLDGVTFGYVCVLEDAESLDDLTRRLLEQTALLVALEFLKARIRLDVELASQRDLATLLAGGAEDEPRLQQRAALLGLRTTSANRVLRVRMTATGRELNDLAAVVWLTQHRLQASEPGSVVLPLDAGDIVIVVPWSTDREPSGTQGITKIVRHAVTAGVSYSGPTELTGIAIGIGLPATEASGLRESYQQATRSLDIMRALGRRDGELSISDAGSYALLVAVDLDRQQEFLREMLAPLEEYDVQHGGELVKTLDIFLDKFGSVQQTAASLFLHQTTVRYRLGRIEAITGTKLSDAEARLSLQLALRLRKLKSPG